MLQSTFWTINLCLHCPVHFLMLFGVVANARKDKHNKRAIANGWPAPVAGFMGFYSHLTTCTQLLTIVYLAVHTWWISTRAWHAASNQRDICEHHWQFVGLLSKR
jgi:hypothetical protein